MALSRKFFARAQASLCSTRNLFGKLCLLALLQCIPVFGQIVTLGYLLGWAREAAWKLETPLPAHVLGGSDATFWPRGFKAWLVRILYFALVCLACFGIFHLALLGLHSFDRLGQSIVAGFAAGIMFLVVCGLLTCMYVGLVRLSVYGSFRAAWQWGASLRMAFHDFGGLVKIALTSLLLRVVLLLLAIVAIMGGCTVASALGFDAPLGSYAIQLISAGQSSAAASEEMLALFVDQLTKAPLMWLLLLILCIPENLIDALVWRAMGNWAAGFDVARWGKRTEPMPFEREGGEKFSQPSIASSDATTAPPASTDAAAAPAVSVAEAPVADAAVAPAASAEPVEGQPLLAAADVDGSSASGTEGASCGAASPDQDSAVSQSAPSCEAAAAPCAVPALNACGAKPAQRSHPVLIIVLCYVAIALICVAAGALSSWSAQVATTLMGGAYGSSATSAAASSTSALEGTWLTSDGETIVLKADRTFTLAYASGAKIQGTYSVNEIADYTANGDTVSASVSAALSMLGKTGIDLNGSRGFTVTLNASSGTNSSGENVSGQVRGTSLNLLFVVSGASADLYSLDNPDAQSASAQRQ